VTNNTADLADVQNCFNPIKLQMVIKFGRYTHLLQELDTQEVEL